MRGSGGKPRAGRYLKRVLFSYPRGGPFALAFPDEKDAALRQRTENIHIIGAAMT